MDLRFFFKIGGAQETLASAFLATLLQQDVRFRQSFLEFLDHDGSRQLATLASAPWDVSTEQPTDAGPVDIELRTHDRASIIVIENKVLASSVQPRQLLRYYEALASQKPPWKQIGAIYLAPGDQVGDNEVDLVKKSHTMRSRPADFAARVGWQELDELASTLLAGDGTTPFVTSGFREIASLIEEGSKTKWPPVGNRRIVLGAATRIREELGRVFPQVQLGHPWPARDRYTLWTHHTNVTLWLLLRFDADDKEPYFAYLERDGQVHLSVIGQLKLSAAGRRHATAQSWWKDMIRGGSLVVCGLGQLRVQASGWATIEQKVTGTIDDVVAEATRIGRVLLAEGVVACPQD